MYTDQTADCSDTALQGPAVVQDDPEIRSPDTGDLDGFLGVDHVTGGCTWNNFGLHVEASI